MAYNLQFWLQCLSISTLFIEISGQQEYHPHKYANPDEWSPWRPPWLNADYSVIVRTVYGDVKGFSVPWHIDDLDWDPGWEEYPPSFTRRINCFLGIPYAAPPVGKLRFDRPRKPRWGGLHWDATHFRPACPQSLDEIHRDIPDYPATNVSEDCLYMNIYAPNMTFYLGDDQLYPVLIWFHSGDFTAGSAQVHPGHVLATKGVVVVTFNYRLGVFGFLSLQDEQASGNWGLFDQHMALEFVRENIKAFQGDPDRITIGGDGAGAASVGFHMISEITRDKRFFHQCIMMSGTDLSRWAFLDPYWHPRNYALELAQRLDCPTDDTYRTMICLRDEQRNPWDKILNTSQLVKPKDGVLGVVWAPTVDGGWFLEHPTIPQQPYLRYTPRDMRRMEYWDKNVPCLIGLNTQDGAKIANETEPTLSTGITREDFRSYVVSMLQQWGIQDMYLERAYEAIEFQYTYWPEPENRTARTQEFIHMLTDLNIGAPMDEVLQLQSNHSPQWMYQFNYKSWNDWLPMWMGVSYSAALPYVFGVPFMNETVLNETELVARQFYDYEDRNMSDWMMYMWTNFIREGHPTPNITRNVTWEPQNEFNLTYLVIDWHSYIWFMYRQNKYSFWREYLPRTAKQEFYYATPTPAGYNYVIATGWMSATVIVLFACAGFIIFMIVYQSDLERDKRDYSSQSMPLNLMSQPSQKSTPGLIPIRTSDGDTYPWQQRAPPPGWQTSSGQTTQSTAMPRGWTLGSTGSGQSVPRGWTMGSQGQGQRLSSRSSGGMYSNSEFSDDEDKPHWSDMSAAGPEPYSTLDGKLPTRGDRSRPLQVTGVTKPTQVTQESQSIGPDAKFGTSARNVPGSYSMQERHQPYVQSRNPPGNQNRPQQRPPQTSTNIRSPYATHSVV